MHSTGRQRRPRQEASLLLFRLSKAYLVVIIVVVIVPVVVRTPPVAVFIPPSVIRSPATLPLSGCGATSPPPHSDSRDAR